jgi:cell division protein FtsI (penicillin-binding protein 3)
LIEFHPPLGRRVISPFTAAEMKRMLEGVVLRGTGPKAILDGYSSAGKTGTAQKIDASGRYSHHVHIASFAGFAPVNNPAVTVLVVLDSPAGGYPKDGGGAAAAPVFARIAQQVLAYMNVPHDVELQDPRRMWVKAHIKEDDTAEAAPDYVASAQENLDTPAAPASPQVKAPAPTVPVQQDPSLRTVAATNKPVKAAVPLIGPMQPPATLQQTALETNSQSRATVVLDVAGGVLVPDFHGKSLRVALEEAESAGLELEVNGSGVGLDQAPAAGSRIPPGGHVSVHFGR